MAKTMLKDCEYEVSLRSLIIGCGIIQYGLVFVKECVSSYVQNVQITLKYNMSLTISQLLSRDKLQ